LNLYEPTTLKKFLSRHGLTATKGLGQHFLCSGPVVLSIVGAVNGIPGILEIGPGPGVLTGPLSEAAEKTIALELDQTMIEALKESAPKAEVRLLDALEADLAALLSELPQPCAVVSNLPYYITAALLTRIAEASQGISKAVLMMQKEVALRVMAKPGSSDRGSLSVYLQAKFDISTVADAPAGAFFPPPKVDSRVLAFTPKPSLLEPDDEAGFFAMVRFGFAQPRKTMVNNLVAGYRVSRDEAVEWIESSGLTERSRPQELSFDEWRRLWDQRKARQAKSG
jgi:16S rRNA (adenine1518-N6/adenine1519-N6)-dimethyltransferase